VVLLHTVEKGDGFYEQFQTFNYKYQYYQQVKNHNSHFNLGMIVAIHSVSSKAVSTKRTRGVHIMKKRIFNKLWFAGLLLAVTMTGCGSDGGGHASTDTIGGACEGAACVSLSGGALTAPGDLTSASSYVILAKTGISNTGTTGATKITGNLGLSPAAASFITGFTPLTADATNVFSTSPNVTGKIYAATYAAPTPANLTTASGNMLTAYTDANGKAPAGGGLTTACPGVGNFGGRTITPGVYTCTTDVLIPTGTNVTLKGSGIYVIRTTGGLTQSADTQVILEEGALAKNIFWVAGGVVDIGTNATMQGVILAATNITLKTGAKVNGRLLSQTAVNLDSNTVVVP
jgi:hypothetical protein